MVFLAPFAGVRILTMVDFKLELEDAAGASAMQRATMSGSSDLTGGRPLHEVKSDVRALTRQAGE